MLRHRQTPPEVSGSPQPAPRYPPYGDQPETSSGSPTYPLDILAAFSADRKKILLSVVNPTEEGQSFSPKIGGVKLGDQGRLYRIAPPSLSATNEAGKEPAVKIVESAQNGLPDSILIPPVSVSLYEFDVD